MNDGPILVAEIAYRENVALDFEECEAIALALGKSVMDDDAVKRALVAHVSGKDTALAA